MVALALTVLTLILSSVIAYFGGKFLLSSFFSSMVDMLGREKICNYQSPNNCLWGIANSEILENSKICRNLFVFSWHASKKLERFALLEQKLEKCPLFLPGAKTWGNKFWSRYWHSCPSYKLIKSVNAQNVSRGFWLPLSLLSARGSPTKMSLNRFKKNQFGWLLKMSFLTRKKIFFENFICT